MEKLSFARELTTLSNKNGTVMKHKPTSNTSKFVHLMEDLVTIKPPSLNFLGRLQRSRYPDSVAFSLKPDLESQSLSTSFESSFHFRYFPRSFAKP